METKETDIDNTINNIFEDESEVGGVSDIPELENNADSSIDDDVSADLKPEAKETPDTDSIKKAIEEGFSKVTPKQEVPAPPKLTEEELEKYLRKAKYSTEDLRELGLVTDETEAELADRKVQFLKNLLSRPVEEAKAYAEIVAQAQREQLEKAIAPIREYVEQAQRKQTEETFYTKYPDLKKHEEIVNLVTQNLVQTNQINKQTSLDKAFELINTKTNNFIKQFSGNTTATQKSQVVPGEVPKPASSTATSRRSQESTTRSTGNVSLRENPMSIFDDY